MRPSPLPLARDRRPPSRTRRQADALSAADGLKPFAGRAAPSAAAIAGLARFMLSSEAGAVPLPMDAVALEAVGDEIARRRMGAMQP